MNRNNEDFLNAYKAYEATAIKVYGSANIYEDDNQCTETGNKLKLRLSFKFLSKLNIKS